MTTIKIKPRHSALCSLKLCIGHYEGTGKAHLSLVGGIEESFLEEEMSTLVFCLLVCLFTLGFKEVEQNKRSPPLVRRVISLGKGRKKLKTINK